MQIYNITNSKTNEFYIKAFTDTSEARHFITNHLDLSLNWQINTLDTCTKDNCSACNSLRNNICVVNLPF